jgi:hypothetical protein
MVLDVVMCCCGCSSQYYSYLCAIYILCGVLYAYWGSGRPQRDVKAVQNSLRNGMYTSGVQMHYTLCGAGLSPGGEPSPMSLILRSSGRPLVLAIASSGVVFCNSLDGRRPHCQPPYITSDLVCQCQRGIFLFNQPVMSRTLH